MALSSSQPLHAGASIFTPVKTAFTAPQASVNVNIKLQSYNGIESNNSYEREDLDVPLSLLLQPHGIIAQPAHRHQFIFQAALWDAGLVFYSKCYAELLCRITVAVRKPSRLVVVLRTSTR
jgi:hypothetical protein